tara:strand:- start:6348 stop:7649 length:1302 start_codon:yes stop_codon:yes gene_type:complete
MSSQQYSQENRIIDTEDGEIILQENPIDEIDEETQTTVKIVNRATAFGQLYIALLVLLDLRKNSVLGILKGLDADKTAATASIVYNSFQEKMIGTDAANFKQIAEEMAKKTNELFASDFYCVGDVGTNECFTTKQWWERWTKDNFHPALILPINMISESIDVVGEASNTMNEKLFELCNQIYIDGHPLKGLYDAIINNIGTATSTALQLKTGELIALIILGYVAINNTGTILRSIPKFGGLVMSIINKVLDVIQIMNERIGSVNDLPGYEDSCKRIKQSQSQSQSSIMSGVSDSSFIDDTTPIIRTAEALGGCIASMISNTIIGIRGTFNDNNEQDDSSVMKITQHFENMTIQYGEVQDSQDSQGSVASYVTSDSIKKVIKRTGEKQEARTGIFSSLFGKRTRGGNKKSYKKRRTRKSKQTRKQRRRKTKSKK